MKSTVRSVTLFLTLLLCAVSNAEPPAPPTMDQLKQLYTDKQYQPLLQKLAPLLQLRATAAAAYDRYQLYMLKAETHIQLKSSDSAMMALNDAAKAADEKQKPDDAGAARALAELVKKSHGMVYKHVNSPDKAHPETFNVTDTDPDKRKAAFAALFDDGLTAAQPRIKSALADKTSVKPVIDFAKSIGPLRDIEVAATGASKQCDEVLGGLAAHAQEIIAATVTDMSSQVDAAQTKADTTVQINASAAASGRGMGAPVAPIYQRQGLQPQERTGLENILNTCGSIDTGSKVLSDSLGDPGGKFASTIQDADKLAEKTRKVLTTDYTATSSSPTGLQ